MEEATGFLSGSFGPQPCIPATPDFRRLVGLGMCVSGSICLGLESVDSLPQLCAAVASLILHPPFSFLSFSGDPVSHLGGASALLIFVFILLICFLSILIDLLPPFIFSSLH